MNINIIRNDIKPADRIVVPKSNFKMVQHHAIYLGQNNQGVDLIIENKIGFGVRLITADDFFSETNEITRIERFSGSNYDRQLAVERALYEIGKPYNLINYNCESFSNHVQNNKPESKQVWTGFFVGIVALIVGVSFFKK